MFYHSQDQKGIELGRDLRKSLVQPSAQGKVSWDQTNMLRALSGLVLKSSKDEDCTTSLGIFLCVPVLRVKRFFFIPLISSLSICLILSRLTAARALLSNLLREILSSPGYTVFSTTLLLILTFLSTVSSFLTGIQNSSMKIRIMHPFPLPPYTLKCNTEI